MLECGSIGLGARLELQRVSRGLVRHGFNDNGAGHAIDVAVDGRPGVIVLTFEDDAPAFDPRDQPAPVLPKSLDEAQDGGLGLLLVRTLASDIQYERTPDRHNRLTATISAS